MNCWYCYGKAIYNRFEWMQEGIGEIGYLAEWELEQPIKRKKPTGIFVCSTYELFHSPDKFARDETFKIIEKCPQHRFYILTKFPQNIDRPMPDNVWLGVTVTNEGDLLKTWQLGRKDAKIRFVSIEPMLENIEPKALYYKTRWIIIGRLTGYGKKHNPKREWIDKWVRYASMYKIPIFLKNNLKEIWGEPLIQEFPSVA